MMLSRVFVGITSVLSTFRATGPWKAIWEEWEPSAVAATPYGEQDLAFRETRR